MTVAELRKALEKIDGEIVVLIPDDVFLYFADTVEVRVVDNDYFMNGPNKKYIDGPTKFCIIE